MATNPSAARGAELSTLFGGRAPKLTHTVCQADTRHGTLLQSPCMHMDRPLTRHAVLLAEAQQCVGGGAGAIVRHLPPRGGQAM